MKGTNQPDKRFLTVDGSILEGGGSILRLSSAFSVITGKPVEIRNIRKGRRKPGLAAQHLTGLKVMATLFGLELEGAYLGSGTVRINHGNVPETRYDAVIKTAGSISLAFQPALIAAMTNKRKLEIQVNGGGTYGMAAPPVDYLERVYCSTMNQQGIRTAIEVFKQGFFPRGGAKAMLTIFPLTDPGELKALELVDFPRPILIKGISVASDALTRASVADRQARAATFYFEKHLPEQVEIDIRVNYTKTDCPGSGITLWVENEKKGFSSFGAADFGARGKSSEIVGKNAARQLVKEFITGAAVDSHLADQLIPYMAHVAVKSNHKSQITVPEMTLHVKTNIAISKLFFPGLHVESRKVGKKYLITTRARQH